MRYFTASKMFDFGRWARYMPGIALTLFFAFLWGVAQAQFQKPEVNMPSPNAASLGLYGKVPVSQYTGTPSIDIPVYTIKDGSMEVPISLSYHASGVRVNEHPGWVGQNWNLNAGGAITRVVKDIPDEFDGGTITEARGFYFKPEVLAGGDWDSQTKMENIDKLGNVDSEPDEFSFNFLGKSGSFYLDHTGHWKVRSEDFFKVELLSTPLLDIPNDMNLPDGVPHNSFDAPSYLLQDLLTSFSGFVLTASDGTRYEFGGTSSALEYSVDFFGISNDDWKATTWNLTKIVSPEGNVISLTYEVAPVEQGKYVGSFYPSVGFTGLTTYKGTSGLDICPPGQRITFEQVTASGYYGGALIRPTYLKQIDFALGKIVFNNSVSNELGYSTRIWDRYIDYYNTQIRPTNPQGFRQFSYFPRLFFLGNQICTGDCNEQAKAAEIMAMLKWRKLDGIEIFDKNNVKSASYGLAYGNANDERLSLSEFRILDKANNSCVNKYSFDYYNKAAYKLPEYLDVGDQTDQWGFFNQHSYPITNVGLGYYSVFEQHKGASQFLDVLQQGSLSKITYPTGGTTELVYERHDAANTLKFNEDGTITIEALSDFPIGGVRIQSIKERDGVSADKTTSYEYKAGNASSGILSGKNQFFWALYQATSNSGGTLKREDTFSYQNLLPTGVNANGSHVGYSEVKEKYSDGSFKVFKYTNYQSIEGGQTVYHLDEAIPLAKRLTSAGAKYDERIDLSFERGQLLSEESYVPLTSTTSRKVQMKTIKYKRLSEGFARSVKSSYFNVCEDNASSVYEGYAYKYYTYFFKPEKEELYQYAENDATKYTLDVTDYTYNSWSDLGLPAEVKTTRSGQIGVVKNRYVADYIFPNADCQAVYDNCVAQNSSSQTDVARYCGELVNLTCIQNQAHRFDSHAISKMKARGFGGILVEQQIWDNQNSSNELRLVDGYLNSYRDYGSAAQGNYKVQYIKRYTGAPKSTAPLTEIEYNSGAGQYEVKDNVGYTKLTLQYPNSGGYTPRGEPKQFAGEDGIWNYFNWYNDGIRTGLIQSKKTGVLETTFEYANPLAGVSQINDLNLGTATKYTYDGFNRLETIRDYRDNLVKSFAYNLKNSSGCPTKPSIVDASGNICGAVDKVRLLWRTADFTRLNGAKIQGSNDGATWTDIYAITANATGTWQEFTFSNATVYQHVRLASGPNGYGELREIEFYSGATMLSGKEFGSDPNVTGMGWQNAIDGNPGNTWHGEYQGVGAHGGASNFVGLSLSCATTCIKPDIIKTAGATVCASTNQPVTLMASGCSGTVTWFRDGVQVSTGATLTTLIAGSYTAKCSSGSCTSAASNALVVTQTAGCAPLCIVNRVRLHWRSADFARLNGAKIQGSNDGSTWTDIYTIGVNATGAWQDFAFTNTTAYQHVRYAASTAGVGELAEIEFYNGEVKMTGVPFGSEPNISNLPWQNAFDGNTATSWHGEYQGQAGHIGPSNFVGLSLTGCATTCIKPSIVKTVGTTVCQSGGKGVTLMASGFTGSVTWFRNGVQVATGLTYVIKIPGNYTAKSTNGTCTSTVSNEIVVAQDAGCASICVVNKVRLHWRPTDFTRLNGAKIQGSNDGTSWTDIYTIGVNATGTWQEFTFANTVSYQHVRFAASATGVGELAELEFYNDDEKLSGTEFGSEPNISNLQWQNVFDGNVATTWHGVYQGVGAHVGPSNFAGISLFGCATTCIKPDIIKTAGTTVCPTTNESVTLMASGCSGTVTWFRDGTQVGTGVSFTTSAAGTYTAKCSSGTCTSAASAGLVVTQTANCAPATACLVNKVRILYRDSNFQRLNGAKIQGSNDGSTWTDIYTITVDGTGSWQEFTFSNTTSYQHVRYAASPTGFGELREIKFYSGDVILNGTTFGSDPNVTGMGWQKAFDGDEVALWHGEYIGLGTHAGPSNFVGMSLSCATTCIKPDIYRVAGATVCPTGNQQVTLMASGCSGTVTWFRNGVQVGTGQTLTTSIAGSYTAKCTSGSCTSAASNALMVTQSSSCFAVGTDKCILNKVRLLFRTADFARLNGAKIQGSNDGATWTDIYTIGVNGTGNWQEFTFTNTTSYQHIRYAARPTDGVGDLREIQFYNGDVMLTGTKFGSEPNVTNLGWQNAMDGDEATAWHGEYQGVGAHLGASNFVGLSLTDCATTCIKPDIFKTVGTTVCASSNQQVTLTASGCSGTVLWFRNGSQVGSGPTLVTSIAGSYTAKCSSDNCASAPSNALTVTQEAGCPAVCVVNKVRLHWRSSDFTRLNGAKIQGSNDGAAWSDIYTINVNATGAWQEFTFSNTTSYQHVRYAAAPGGSGELTELEFYNGTTKLEGTAFGSEPNIAGLEWENVFDGALVAMWHGVYLGPGAHVGPSNFVGISITGCATTSIKPEIIRKAGSTVCASVNQSVTLVATSGSGTITWFRDGTQVATGDTLTTTTPGSYTAKTTLGAYTSVASEVLVIAQAAGCSPVNCVLNKVRLKWRTADFNRLNGAKIQGSADGATWTDLYTINVSATGNWQEFTFSNTTSYQHVRFASGPTGYGELVEIEFYNGSTKLLGKAFGSEPNVGGLEWENAIDGDSTRAWHGTYQGLGAHVGASNFVGLSLTGCATTCIKPEIIKIEGNTVCASANSTVTLIASGCSESVVWYRDGIRVGTGVEYTTSLPGTYTAKCISASCSSSPSNAVVVTQTAGCAPLCIVNKVRLQWRTTYFARLIGAKIQGSNDGADWTDLYTFTQAANGQMQEFTFTNTTAYQHVRYAAAPGGSGELAELEFYNGANRLSGTAFGSSPNIAGLDWPNVFDGEPSTTWHGVYTGDGAHVGPSNFVGLSMTGCATTCIKPDIIKISGTTVCPTSNQKVTLMASGCTGTVTWYRDGTEVGTGQTLVTGIAGSYTAKCTSGSCTSAASNALAVTQTDGCFAANKCVLNKVRILFRTANAERLNGAKIQGSNDGATWADIYTITVNGTGNWQEFSFTNTTSYQHVRYAASPGGSGELREIKFLNGDVLLTGTKFGSIPNVPGMGWELAMDGNELSTWHGEYRGTAGHTGTSNFVGLSLTGCAATCIKPEVSKTAGTAVCPGAGQFVTLTASGCSGTVTWFRNGAQVATGDTLKTDIAGSYTAKCSSGACSSVESAPLVVSQSAGCLPTNKCVVNKVRLLFRTSFFERLNGAKIQGSNDGATWSDIYTINVNATGNWQEFAFSNTTSYQHIRYTAATGSAGELREIVFLNGNTILTGTQFGSSPNIATMDWPLAMDGNESTIWHGEYQGVGAHTGPSNFVGLSLTGCATTCLKPDIFRTEGSTVCQTGNQTVKLIASGCSGTVKWYRDGIEVGSGQTYTATISGTYTARCSSGSCSSSASNPLVISQTLNCAPQNGCLVNKVRLLYRTADTQRLNGAKIQGSNNGADWTDIYTINVNGTGLWQEFSFSNTTTYQHVRFVSSPTGLGELREIKFYNNDVQLTGTKFGSDPNVDELEWQNALDGNEETTWHGSYQGGEAHIGTSNFVGLSLTGCANTCIKPDVFKIEGSTVCPSTNQQVKLIASGYSGTVKWYRDGVEVASGQIYVTSQPGTYTAKSSSGSCTSAASAGVVIAATSNCAAINCVVNKVKVMFRFGGECCMDRLIGAKIQGSTNGTSWTDIYTFNTAGSGSMVEYSFSNTTAYGFLRFVAGNSGYGELTELEFYNGSTKLQGSAFGVGNYNLAFDSNNTTKWETGTVGTSNYAGLALTNCGSCAAPSINISSTQKTACVPKNHRVTLSSTGSGTIKWYKNGALVASGTGTTYETNEPGTYTATITLGSCTSAASQALVVPQTAGCTDVVTPVTPTLSIWKSGGEGQRSKIRDLANNDVILLSDIGGRDLNWFLATNGQITNPAANGYYTDVELRLTGPGINFGWKSGITGTDTGPYGLYSRDGGIAAVAGDYQLTGKIYNGSNVVGTTTVNFKIMNSCNPVWIQQVEGNTACVLKNHRVKLSSIDCGSTTTWYLNGTQVGSGSTYETNVPGTYQAKCSGGICGDVWSNQINISETPGCNDSPPTAVTSTMSIWKGGPSRVKIQDLLDGNQIQLSSFAGGIANWFVTTDGQNASRGLPKYYDRMSVTVTRGGQVIGSFDDPMGGQDAGPYGVFGRDGGVTPVPGNYAMQVKIWNGSTVVGDRSISFSIVNPCNPISISSQGGVTTVCKGSATSAEQKATLTVSGCSGNVRWFKNGSQVGSGATFETSSPGSYYATCETSTCYVQSNTITLTQTANCGVITSQTIVGVDFGNVDNRYYYWSSQGTTSRGTYNTTLSSWDKPYTFELPAGKVASDIVEIAFYGNSNPARRTYVWYRDGTMSIGYSDDLDGQSGPVAYTCPPGKTPANIVGIAMDNSKQVYTWYNDNTYTVGDVTNLASIKSATSYVVPAGKTAANILGTAIDINANQVVTWYSDGTVSKGTPEKLDQYLQPERFE